MGKLDQLRAMREARYAKPVTNPTCGAKALRQARAWAVAHAPEAVTRVTRVTAVTCQVCGQRLPALTKAAAKQKAYRERKRRG